MIYFTVPKEPHITSSQCSHPVVSGDSSCSDHQCSWIPAGMGVGLQQVMSLCIIQMLFDVIMDNYDNTIPGSGQVSIYSGKMLFNS